MFRRYFSSIPISKHFSIQENVTRLSSPIKATYLQRIINGQIPLDQQSIMMTLRNILETKDTQLGRTVLHRIANANFSLKRSEIVTMLHCYQKFQIPSEALKLYKKHSIHFQENELAVLLETLEHSHYILQGIQLYKQMIANKSKFPQADKNMILANNALLLCSTVNKKFLAYHPEVLREGIDILNSFRSQPQQQMQSVLSSLSSQQQSTEVLSVQAVTTKDTNAATTAPVATDTLPQTTHNSSNNNNSHSTIPAITMYSSLIVLAGKAQHVEIADEIFQQAISVYSPSLYLINAIMSANNQAKNYQRTIDVFKQYIGSSVNSSSNENDSSNGNSNSNIISDSSILCSDNNNVNNSSVVGETTATADDNDNTIDADENDRSNSNDSDNIPSTDTITTTSNNRNNNYFQMKPDNKSLSILMKACTETKQILFGLTTYIEFLATQNKNTTSVGGNNSRIDWVLILRVLELYEVSEQSIKELSVSLKEVSMPPKELSSTAVSSSSTNTGTTKKKNKGNKNDIETKNSNNKSANSNASNNNDNNIHSTLSSILHAKNRVEQHIIKLIKISDGYINNSMYDHPPQEVLQKVTPLLISKGMLSEERFSELMNNRYTHSFYSSSSNVSASLLSSALSSSSSDSADNIATSLTTDSVEIKTNIRVTSTAAANTSIDGILIASMKKLTDLCLPTSYLTTPTTTPTTSKATNTNNTPPHISAAAIATAVDNRWRDVLVFFEKVQFYTSSSFASSVNISNNHRSSVPIISQETKAVLLGLAIKALLVSHRDDMIKALLYQFFYGSIASSTNNSSSYAAVDDQTSYFIHHQQNENSSSSNSTGVKLIDRNVDLFFQSIKADENNSYSNNASKINSVITRNSANNNVYSTTSSYYQKQHALKLLQLFLSAAATCTNNPSHSNLQLLVNNQSLLTTLLNHILTLPHTYSVNNNTPSTNNTSSSNSDTFALMKGEVESTVQSILQHIKLDLKLKELKRQSKQQQQEIENSGSSISYSNSNANIDGVIDELQNQILTYISSTTLLL